MEETEVKVELISDIIEDRLEEKMGLMQGKQRLEQKKPNQSTR